MVKKHLPLLLILLGLLDLSLILYLRLISPHHTHLYLRPELFVSTCVPCWLAIVEPALARVHLLKLHQVLKGR